MINIHTLPFWHLLTEQEKELATRGATARTYEKGAYIHGFSDACLGMVHVEKGSIRVFMTSEEGREVTLFHIEEGACCILSSSCAITGLNLDVQLMAEDDVEITAIHAGTVKSLMESNVEVRCFAYELSTKRLSSVVWVMQEILFAHFDARLAKLLLSIYEKTGDKQIKMTQESMAQEVNSAREVVARMLKSFAKEGWIEMSRGKITLLDIDALENLQ